MTRSGASGSGCRLTAAFDDLHAGGGALSAVAELQRALPDLVRTPTPLRLVLDRRPFV